DDGRGRGSDRGDDQRGRDGDYRGRGDDRRSWDRGDNGRHRGDRYDRGQRWERGRYPSVYFSPYRYRYAWRPPSGYYAYNWSFGDFLPRNWYGSGSWLSDPWRYDLPWPPPGYEWVRVGYDALLVDEYTGRVVQVVRNIFW
uniref:RcnB family protein n=1 Tax=Phenylobacterium sp. TaxID=1871053 RepID=UPI0037C825BC